jgi:hypothetical protein
MTQTTEVKEVETESCAYIKDRLVDKTSRDGQQLYGCRVYEKCTLNGNSPDFPSCKTCSTKLLYSDKEFKSKFQDQLLITDRLGNKTHALRNLLAGRPSFLVCGGPSAKELDLSLIEQKGIWSLAVNNMAGYYHPSAFVCSDPPSKFHNGIWYDPTVMKFIPTPKFRGGRANLREKLPDGTFKPFMIDDKQVTTRDCPNTWGFERRSWFLPDDTFFMEDGAAWGNHAAGVIRTGREKTVCTMLLGLRLLTYLGSRCVFLVGVDFFMDPSAGLQENYAFGENRDHDAIGSNNNQFSVVNRWLIEMQKNGVFERFGIEIYNCNPNSGLRAFGHLPYNEAVEVALEGFPDSPFDLNDWYRK